MTVDADALTIHTFGTPFLTLPRKGCRTAIGEAWLGLPFVKVDPSAPPEFRKWVKLYRGVKGSLSLRIYTADAERLRALL